MQRDAVGSIESPRSWHAAFLTLAILSVSFGSPLLAVVGMRDMQAALHTDRSVMSLASALVWIGNGLGGIPMGWLADRIGIRRTVLIGALAMASGLALSSLGTVWALYVGHGLLIGLLGNGAIYAPLIVYVSRWFDRRRGTAHRADRIRTIYLRHDLAGADRRSASPASAGKPTMLAFWRRRSGDYPAAAAHAAASP